MQTCDCVRALAAAAFLYRVLSQTRTAYTDALLEHSLLRSPKPSVRIYLARDVCLPSAVFMNDAAAQLFGTVDPVTCRDVLSYFALPGGCFVLPVHPDTLAQHLLTRVSATLQGRLLYSFRGRFLRGLKSRFCTTDTGSSEVPSGASSTEATTSSGDMPSSASSYQVFFASYHVSLEPSEDGIGVRSLTYAFEDVIPTAETLLLGPSTLQQLYTAALRSAMVTLHQSHQLRQLLHATASSSLAEALIAQLSVPHHQA